MAKRNSTPPETLPTLLDHPGYRLAEEKLESLRSRHAEKSARLQELREAKEDTGAAAVALLEGDETALQRIDRNDEVDDLEHSIAVLAESIRLQTDVRDKFKREASDKARPVMVKRSRDRARRFCELAEELVRLEAEDAADFNRCGSLGINARGAELGSAPGPTTPVRVFNRLGDGRSILFALERQAATVRQRILGNKK